MSSWFARSRLGSFMNTVGALPVRALRSFAPEGRTRSGKREPHQWFLALGLAAMLCVPHAYWNNLYGALFALSALVLYWWDRAVYGGEPQNPAAPGAGWWLFLLMCFLCTAWARHRAGNLRLAVFFLTGFLLVYLVSASFRSREERDLLLGCVTGALILTAAYGLAVYFLRGESYFVPMNGQLYPRLSATLEHGINYSEFAAMALPLCLVWTLERKKPGVRIALTALLALPCAAVVLTYARTGWVALAVALAVLLWFRNRKLLIPAALVCAAAVFFLPGGVQTRLLSMLHFSDAAASGRFTLWRECLAALREHWLGGAGLGPENFYDAYLPFSTGTLEFRPPHSNMGYLEMFLSTGVFGFAGFLAFFFGIFPRIGAAIRRCAGGPERFGLCALIASLAGAAAANVFEYLWFYPRILFFWCAVYGLALGGTEEAKTPAG